MNKYKYISRVDYDNTEKVLAARDGTAEREANAPAKIQVMRAWQVHLPKELKNRTAWFSDKPYGGKAKALQAAIKYRDKALKKAGLIHLLEAKVVVREQIRPTASNTSGVVGVTHNAARNYWSATFYDGTKQKRKQFAGSPESCEAFKRACNQRYDWAGELVIKRKSVLPCKPDNPVTWVE